MEMLSELLKIIFRLISEFVGLYQLLQLYDLIYKRS